MENLQSLHSAEVKRDAASQKSRNDGAPKATDKVYEGYKVHSGLDRLRSDMEESLPQGSSPRAASRRSRIDGAPKATDKAYEEYKVHLGLDRLRSDMEESFPPGSSPRSTESPRRDLSQPKSGLAKLPSQTTASPARTPGFSPLASEQTIFPACDGCNQAFLTKESLDLHLLVCTRHGKRIVVKESARERRSAKRLLGKRRKENDLGEKRKDTPAQISMDAVPVAPAMNSTLLPISLGDLERRKEEPSSKQRLVSSPKEMTSPKHRSFSSPKRKTTPMEKVHPRLDPEAMGFLPGHMSKRFIPKNDSPAEDPDFTRPINTGSDGISHFQSVAPGVDLYNPKTQMGYSPTSMFAGPSPTLPNPMIPMGKGSVRKFRTRTASSNDGASAPGVVDGEPVSGDPLSAKQILTHIHSADSDRSKVLRNIGLIPLPTFHYQENDWVSVPERYRPTILDILKEIVHPKHELDANGFTLGPWTEDYIKGMQKCFHCRSKSSSLVHTFLPLRCLKPAGILLKDRLYRVIC